MWKVLFFSRQAFALRTWPSFRRTVRMKPLSDFFFDTDVKDMGPDMVSLFVIYWRILTKDVVLSHELTKITFFWATGSFLFCLLVTGVRHFWFGIFTGRRCEMDSIWKIFWKNVCLFTNIMNSELTQITLFFFATFNALLFKTIINSPNRRSY